MRFDHREILRTNKKFVLGAGALLLTTFTFILASERAERPAAAAPSTKPAKALTRAKVDYEREIAPIFKSSCAACHGADQPQAQLRLDSLAAALTGGAWGKVILPGNSNKSPLVRRLLGLDKPQMPYGSDPLPPKQIALIRAWIDQGATITRGRFRSGWRAAASSRVLPLVRRMNSDITSPKTPSTSTTCTPRFST